MRRTSSISAEARGIGNGGNLDLEAGFIVAVPAENSDIIAKAEQGNGGNIKITAQGVFGIEYRDKLTSLSDINASSDFGLDGVVAINTSDVDPSQGLATLPSEPVNPQLDQRCQADSSQETNYFVTTGRGGLPLGPEEISSNAVWEDLRSVTATDNQPSKSAPMITSNRSNSGVLVEAQGWVKSPDGRIILTAQAPTATLGNSWKTPASCAQPEGYSSSIK